ncbi:non-ribosomal peptide synthase [Fusarium phyllophilum]|uniref:Non-ribosomal peptide synthase n=1 Tax=Fusarium phyllophilum TaxID=47803 RepID=A0A8H5ID63_9HYPO|nr:non-ribosomal peptide synthase [Fusarium phyllophilum]
MAGGVPAILSSFSQHEKTRKSQTMHIQQLFPGATLITDSRNLNIFQETSMLVTSVEGLQNKNLCTNGASNKFSVESDELAAILFTSGSTGRAKAIEFTSAQLKASVVTKQKFHQTTRETRFLSWVSLDHSANFCELHLSSIFTASELFHVAPRLFNEGPGDFFRLLSRHRIGYSFATNSLLAMACAAFSGNEANLDFSHLRVLMVGGEANRVGTLQKANDIFRQNGGQRQCIKAAYGLSETCSACFYNDETPDYDVMKGHKFASVGEPVSGAHLRLVDDEGNLLGLNTVGNVQLSGSVVFKAYYQDPEATSRAFTRDGWFNTGDIGRLTTESKLEIIGRSKEVTIINGLKYSFVEVENSIEMAHIPGITRTYLAAFAITRDSQQTEDLIILFNPTNDGSDRNRVIETVKQIHQTVLRYCHKAPLEIIPLPKELLPKSTIGKFSRQKFKDEYSAGLFDPYKLWRGSEHDLAPSKPLARPIQASIAAVLSRVLNVPYWSLGVEDTPITAGADSLTFTRIKKDLEEALSLEDIPMRTLIEASTLEDLETSLLQHSKVGNENLLTIFVSGGSKCPIFLLPPGSGGVVPWTSLIKYLPDRQIYALRLRGLESGEDPFADLDELLDVYQDVILTTQPVGPYALLGMSFGGTVAFELAKRFEGLGKQVAFAGALDTPPSISFLESSGFLRFLVLDLLGVRGVLTQGEIESLKHFLRDRQGESISHALFERHGPTLHAAGYTRQRIQAWLDVVGGVVNMSLEYIATGTVDKFDVFHAGPVSQWGFTEEEWSARIRVWDGYVTSLVYHRVGGDHLTLTDQAHIEGFQVVLNKALENRGI